MSDYYDHVKRAFIETLDALGDRCPKITYKGTTKRCITGEIVKKRQADVAGYLPQVASQIDILDADFNALVQIGIGDRSTVRVGLDGITGTDLRIMSIANDPSDPVIGLIVIGDK